MTDYPSDLTDEQVAARKDAAAELGKRIAKPPVPAKRSSGTRRPRSASRSGHSPSWGGR